MAPPGAIRREERHLSKGGGADPGRRRLVRQTRILREAGKGTTEGAVAGPDGSRLVAPVGRVATVRLFVHREGPDLALEDEAVRGPDAGMEAPVPVLLGLGDVVLEPQEQRLEPLVDRLQGAVAVLLVHDDDPERDDVVNLVDGEALRQRLFPDSRRVLDPVLQGLVPHACLGEGLADLRLPFSQPGLVRRGQLRESSVDCFECLGLEDPESGVLETRLQPAFSQPLGLEDVTFPGFPRGGTGPGVLRAPSLQESAARKEVTTEEFPVEGGFLVRLRRGVIFHGHGGPSVRGEERFLPQSEQGTAFGLDQPPHRLLELRSEVPEPVSEPAHLPGTARNLEPAPVALLHLVHAVQQPAQGPVYQELVSDVEREKDGCDGRRDAQDPEPPAPIHQRLELGAVLPDFERSAAAGEELRDDRDPATERAGGWLPLRARKEGIHRATFGIEEERVQVPVPAPRVRLPEGLEPLPDGLDVRRSLDVRGERRGGLSHQLLAILAGPLDIVLLEEEGQRAENQRHDHRSRQAEPPTERHASRRGVVLAHRRKPSFIDRAIPERATRP